MRRGCMLVPGYPIAVPELGACVFVTFLIEILHLKSSVPFVGVC